MSEEHDEGRAGADAGAIRGVMGRLLGGAERELLSGERLDAAKGAIGSVLETGDKAKTEIVKMVAREVRGYLEALEIKDELKELLEDYELEVNATFKLKPLMPDAEDTSEEDDEAGAEGGQVAVSDETTEEQVTQEDLSGDSAN